MSRPLDDEPVTAGRPASTAPHPGDGLRDQSLAINLRHLRALSAVVASGTITGAADRMFRVPSAVTRSINELEASLGKTLIERGRRGVSLNRYGHRVLMRARRIEQEFKAAHAQLIARGGVRPEACRPTLLSSILNGRRLAVFVGLADRRTMPSLAREFGLTQPAVSAALKALEDGLGAPFFTRTPRGLVPTPAGELLAFHFRRVLAELRHIGPDLAEECGAVEGGVTIGALPLGRTQILPQAIGSVIARHRGLRIATEESPYDVLVASLRSGDVDFIFGALRQGAEARDLDQEALFEDHISVIARAGHPFASGRPITFDELQHSSWVLPRRGSPSRDLLNAFFADAGRASPEAAVETGDLAILRGLLLDSDMLTAISAHQLRHEIRDGSLVVLDFPLERARRHIGIMQRQGALPSPGARALMAEIRSVLHSTPIQTAPVPA